MFVSRVCVCFACVSIWCSVFRCCLSLAFGVWLLLLFVCLHRVCLVLCACCAVLFCLRVSIVLFSVFFMCMYFFSPPRCLFICLSVFVVVSSCAYFVVCVRMACFCGFSAFFFIFVFLCVLCVTAFRCVFPCVCISRSLFVSYSCLSCVWF